MTDDLVERVARAMWEAVGADPHDFWGDDFRAYECQARAAIAVLRPALRAEALEGAAKVVEFSPDSHTAREVPLMLDKAAAIRALIPKGPT